jgi:hypothetical protein
MLSKGQHYAVISTPFTHPRNFRWCFWIYDVPEQAKADKAKETE